MSRKKYFIGLIAASIIASAFLTGCESEFVNNTAENTVSQRNSVPETNTVAQTKPVTEAVTENTLQAAEKAIETPPQPTASVSNAEIVGYYTDYADGLMYRLNVTGSFSYWTASISCYSGEWFNLTYSSSDLSTNPYFTEGSSISNIKAEITPYDANGIAGQSFTTIWDPNRVERSADASQSSSQNSTQSSSSSSQSYYQNNSGMLRGEINTMGERIVSYTTSYVCNNGSPEIVRSNLGNAWHVTAYNYYYSYGIDWYELYDTDDGDYYGWVDGTYIIWY